MHELALKILEFNANRGGLDEPTLWPAFYGPSGSGKTSRAVQLARELGLPCVRLLLGTMQPDEVLGLPRVLEREGVAVTRWSLPEWAPDDRPILLFLDELDKAHRDTTAAVLTLLAERRIRNVLLPAGSVIVAAMQPVDEDWLSDETNTALAARVVWLPTHGNRTYLESKYGVSLGWMPTREAPRLPILHHPTDRQLDWALAWLGAMPEETWEPVLSGIFDTEVARGLILEIRNARALRPESIARALIEDPKRTKRLGLDRLGQLLPHLADYEDGLPAWEAAFKRILAEASPESAYAALRDFAQTLADKARANGGETTIFGNTSEDDVVAAIERTIAEATTIREAQQQQGDK